MSKPQTGIGERLLGALEGRVNVGEVCHGVFLLGGAVFVSF